MDPGPIPPEEGEEEEEADAAPEEAAAADEGARRALDINSDMDHVERQQRLWDTLRIMSLDPPR